jgi:hypothetical protein
VMNDLTEVFEEFYPDQEDQVKVGLEFQAYKTRSTAHWKKPLMTDLDASQVPNTLRILGHAWGWQSFVEAGCIGGSTAESCCRWL